MMRKKDKLNKKDKLHKKDKIELKGIQDYLSRLDRVPFSVEFGEEWGETLGAGADAQRTYQVGQGEPAFRIRVTEPIPKRDLLASTSLALGEAYMDGRIQVEGDLYAALDLIMSQKGKFALAPHARPIRPLLHTPLTAKQQQREVRSHYDLGNDFYSLWLGETMNYSCAYFQKEDDSLDQAQEQKTARILAKLQLSPGMKLLDIGCGWGKSPDPRRQGVWCHRRWHHPEPGTGQGMSVPDPKGKPPATAEGSGHGLSGFSGFRPGV